MFGLTEAEIYTWIFVVISFGIYIYIGYANRVRDTKGFYVAGQGVPPIANGAATAADWMSGASFISMAGLIAFMGYDGAVYLLGWTGGYVLLATWLAQYLRKFNKYTVPDFVGDRYASQTARLVAAICAMFVSFTYVAGQMRGVGVVFSRFLGVEVWLGVVVGMIIVAFFAVLGGMKGITYTQVAQYTVLIIAYLIPSFALAWAITGMPVPQLALTFTDIVPQLDQITRELGMDQYSVSHRPMIDVLFITIALMCGTAGLPHVIVRFYTVPSVRAARYSAGWALFFIALLYTTAPAFAVFARLNLIDTLNNLPVNELQERADLDWARKWGETGLLTMDDKNDDGVYTMSNDAEVNEVIIDRDIIVLSTPEVAQLPGAMIGLVAAGGLAAALSTASGLLLVISSSFAHDIYYRLLDPNADESRRLLVGRVTILVGIFGAGYLGIYPPGFVGEVVAFAFGLACSSFFPVILLGVFDKRTNSAGAIAGMIVGITFTAAMILIMRSEPLLGMPPMFTNVLGVSAQGIGTVGMVLNFLVTFLVSRATPPPPEHIQQMVENVRVPKGAGAAQAAH